MRLCGLIALGGFALSTAAQQQPPRILQVYRDFPKPGAEAAYRKMEDRAARVCRRFRCPHPYLGLESLTDPKEVWFLNGYDSQADVVRVSNEYEKNKRLMAALTAAVKGKGALIGQPSEFFANYREDFSRGAPWKMGRGRYLVIALGEGEPAGEGTVFETADGDRLTVRPARTGAEAEALAAAGGPRARVFVIRPGWSLPARDWIADDRAFWRARRRK